MLRSRTMGSPIILMLHVLFGVLCMLGALWVFVETLNASENNLGRIRAASAVLALAMWVAYLVAGYWYIVVYPHDKAVILRGPWPFAHDFFMETKEHFVIMLLLLATYLPIAARANLARSRASRTVVLFTSASVALLALAADGFGGVIAAGVRVGLAPR